MRIGYFGGTFDPPHLAHLHVAQAAADAFALDRVLLAPTGVQPLKERGPLAPYEDRVAMMRLLCAQDERMVASEIDKPHENGDANYTIDALARLREEFPGAELFVIVGADSFVSLPRWREPQRLLAEAEWIVVSRPDVAEEELAAVALTPAEQLRLHRLNTVDEDISSTAIRERLRVGVACDKMLSAPVALYIARMHLYHAR